MSSCAALRADESAGCLITMSVLLSSFTSHRISTYRLFHAIPEGVWEKGSWGRIVHFGLLCAARGQDIDGSSKLLLSTNR